MIYGIFTILVNIKFAFQDEVKLYIVSDFMQGGYMFYHLHIENKFCEKSKILFNGNNIIIRNFT